jgi:hypothetical protein
MVRIVDGHRQPCGSCRAITRIRSRQNWYATNHVTEDQATMIDLASDLPSFGLTRTDFENERNRLTKVHGVASVGEVCWAILNRLEKLATNPMRLTELRLAKADFIRKQGSDSSGEMRLLLQSRIRDALKIGAKDFQIVATNCCDECAELDGKIIAGKRALETLPIPNPRCTRQSDHGGSAPNCVCTVIARYAESE